MCEFCTEHGEGKKWYLQMKNYQEELLHAELDRLQKRLGRVDTRLEWNRRMFDQFVLPAATGVPATVDFVTGLPVGGGGDEGGQEAAPESASSGPAPGPQPVAPLPSDDTVTRISKILHFGQVIPLEDVERIFDLADSITRLPCGCRFISTGKTDKRYCFGLGMDKWGVMGKYPNAASSLEVLDKEEAKRLVREYDAEGLMHSVWTGVTPYVMGVCNCDHDCMAYRGYIEHGGPPDFFRGEEVGEVDWELCTGCKSCVSQCQFGAINYSSVGAKVHINPRACFGCGVCRAACPTGAITLVSRDQVPAAAGLWLRA
jgi:NAD-dependent dihydropyrimidine dehydrogenase PreA subunit